MGLYSYLQQTQRFLNDPKQERYNPFDLVTMINQARKHIAKESQCVRVLPPSSGSVATLTLTNPGSNYVSPVVTIGPPDASSGGIQATATMTSGELIFVGSSPITFVGTSPISFIGNSTNAITLTNPGAGYVAVPTVTITDAAGFGSGATAVATLTPHNATVANQEVYPFSGVNSVIAALFPGVESVIGVQSISVSWGTWKPTCQKLDWSSFQAQLRAWNIGNNNYPQVWSQYGQGVNGSAYVWPIPSQTTAWDWDCYCLPLDLVSDADVDVLPYPWTDAVPFYTAYLATIGEARGERRDDTRFFLAEYSRIMREARASVTPAWIPDMYDYG